MVASHEDVVKMVSVADTVSAAVAEATPEGKTRVPADEKLIKELAISESHSTEKRTLSSWK